MLDEYGRAFLQIRVDTRGGGFKELLDEATTHANNLTGDFILSNWRVIARKIDSCIVSKWLNFFIEYAEE